MRREPIESSVIASMGYNPERCELDIEFRATGDVYRYSDVPPEEYQAFMAAESKGEYLNLVFKFRNYAHQIIQRGQKGSRSNLAS
jgi:hypothetical protein